MIWGCFGGNKLGRIVFMNGTVNSDVYNSILPDNLLPFIDDMSVEGTMDLVFQKTILLLMYPEKFAHASIMQCKNMDFH